MITRESVEALRKWAEEKLLRTQVYDRDWHVATIRALCDHYLSTPAAEPTAGDVRADNMLLAIIVEMRREQKELMRVVKAKERDKFQAQANTTARYEREVDEKIEALLAQRQASPSLGEPQGDPSGAAADGDATLAEIEKRWEAAMKSPMQVFADMRYLLAEVRRLREMAMAERERCAKLVPTTWLDPMFHADDTPPLDGLSVEWVCKRIAAAIRASSTDGEGGRETA